MNYINLQGKWELCSDDKKIRTEINLPDDTANALIKNGKLPHPYWDRNELEAQWINRQNWVLTRSIQLDKDEINSAFIHLEIDSMDTMGRIEVNGQTVYKSENMFVPVDVSVKEYLKPGKNTIKIYLDSAEQAALDRAENLPYPIPVMYYPVYSPNRNLIRKVQCHSGWDWGPCLMTAGVYGEIGLVTEETLLRDIHYDLKQTDTEKWNLKVHFRTESSAPGSLPLQINVAGSSLEEKVFLPAGTADFHREMEILSPELWWPNGQGEQNLYDLTLKLGSQTKILRVGFRTIEVIVEDDNVGRSMTFRVNGRDIFCKGANWIPTDALPGEQSRDKAAHLLQSAKEAHMNMIRVWGGGQYEPDFFYEICDELGILVWQDFMFSCSLYPSDRAFLESVDREARAQILRLKNHPSLALWCGNNEDVGALTWFEESKKNRDIYLVDYDRLNEGVLGTAVRELDPEREWWPSSPSAGEGDYSDCWHDDTKGDMHYWSVWHEGKPFESYYDILPRFCSEFGFQSFPSLELVKTYAPEEEWNVSAPSMMHHQKNERGNEIIMSTLCRYFRFPQRFPDFLYLSQVQQAWAIQTAVEYWRSNRPVCMGALYWQLNDNWPVASWASVEYSGDWKLLHFNAARFFRPVHITAWMKDGKLNASLINDNPESVKASYRLNFRSFDGTLKRELIGNLMLEAGSAQKILEENCADEEERRGEFLELILETEKETIRNFLFLHVPRMCDLQESRIEQKVYREGEEYELTLSCDKPAFFTYLTAGMPGHFSDNGFLLMPDEKKTVRFTPADSGKGEPEFRMTHLRETY
jgi:beta-mannosidase